MIRGEVDARREARVPLTLRGPSGRQRDEQVLIDTGYTGDITLPIEVVRELGLNWHSTAFGELADGTRGERDRYLAEVLWMGQWRPVPVIALGGTPMLGTKLLQGHRLTVEIVPDGVVAIESLL